MQKQYLLNKAVGQDGFSVSDSLITDLEAGTFQNAGEVIDFIEITGAAMWDLLFGGCHSFHWVSLHRGADSSESLHGACFQDGAVGGNAEADQLEADH